MGNGNETDENLKLPQSAFHNNAVFFIETEKIHPNPYQPRREFDESRLNELAGSIRMYGILQPLVVTRKEIVKEDGGMAIEYELIAGERRLRASRIAGLREVPALIRSKDDDEKTKLELAIIENLQREDLNPIDRARAFAQLSEEFGFKHTDIAKKVGRSREYVTNTIRILALPDEMLDAVAAKKISEGHARPLLMLTDRPDEQNVLFREILLRKMTVRDAEKISRSIASEKVRKVDKRYSPEIVEMEEKASQRLGARVHIEPKQKGGRIRIDYLDEAELKKIMDSLEESRAENAGGAENTEGAVATTVVAAEEATVEDLSDATPLEISLPDYSGETKEEVAQVAPETIHQDDESNTFEEKLDEKHEEEVEKGEDEGGFSLDQFNI